jgi:hypothetical protein
MGEWAPENVGGTWLGGASGPQPGAKFRGTNRIGKRKWKTVATVIDAESGRRFSFRVATMGLKGVKLRVRAERDRVSGHRDVD